MSGSGAHDYIIRVKKAAIPANGAEDFMRTMRVDVIDPRERRVILRAITLADMQRKLGGGR